MALLAAALLAGCAGSGPDVSNSFGDVGSPTTAADASSVPAGKVITKVEKTQVAKAIASLTADATPNSKAYKIGPQDVLDVSVFQVTELQRTVQVAENGTINLPLLGNVKAAGKTAQEVEQDMAKRLGAKYLQSPQVTVFVREFNSQRITMDGALAKPGVYPIRGQTTLVQMIDMAGGLNEASDETNIVVFREDGGKRTAAKFDFAAIRSGSAEDPKLQQGDVVVVNSSQFKEAFQNVLKVLPVTKMFVPVL
jgi:polysaccharide biosynthesis/export protein